ncbi:MAG: hypothetical protein KJ000_14810 [Pirellulaceae bacterium]|nr:hypothetical protein [Pirellulaceae bacterium]
MFSNRIFPVVVAALVPWIHAFGADDRSVAVDDFRHLPANVWILIHREDSSGGKAFARAVCAENVDRLYLWGTGGAMPARNVYLRYELESLQPTAPQWLPASPLAAEGKWSRDDLPPFRILGQSGPDGLKYDEGPRLQCVGGYHATNRVRWWDFDGIPRPSPIHTFNMACWDSKRQRIVFYSDGCTFALNPSDNTWTDLRPANFPTTCQTVAWASMAYDPAEDQILLFGGGLATNPGGGAPTWIYDCRENAWQRPSLVREPPLRCNSTVVYDPLSQRMVMFGGYDQSAALNDTWIFDGRQKRWEERKPPLAPPPMFAPAVALVPGGGKVLVCGYDASQVRLHQQASSSAIQQTWIYDVAENTWTPIHGDLSLPGYRWLTASGSERHGVILLVAFGPERRTYALRYDPDAATIDLPGAPPGTVAWKYPEQKLSLEQAAAPDPAWKTRLASLPVNKFVNADPPGMLISKTWSTATIDTDRGEVIYTGGGHSGYSGNDIARYRIAENRWSQDFPPRFPPFLEGTNAGIFGWSYGMIPFSQHTYLWYCYDPQSKTVVYLARPSLFDGVQVQLSDDPADVFEYDAQQHGYASWVYDVSAKKMHRPSFGRPFANPWHLALAGTPQGVFAACDNRLFHGRVDRDQGTVQWKLVDAEFPEPREEIRYHYEFQPLLYDETRQRLIQLKGDDNRVDVFVRSLASNGRWEQLRTTGTAAIGREAVYLPKHDTVLWLADKQLFAWDCAAGHMRELEVAMPEGLYTHECAMVYDPGHDICVALIPRSFTGPMQTFLFRFEKGEPRRD